MSETGDLEERVAALEAIVAELTEQPEPEFMSEVRVETLVNNRGHFVRLTHRPSGVTVQAPSRPEAVIKLQKALTDRAGRAADLERRHANRPGGVHGAA